MDWDGIKTQLQGIGKKYRYGLLLLTVGILLMCLPEGGARTEPQQPNNMKQDEQASLQQTLSELLSRIEGAGKVQVLLTESEGQTVHYQNDEDRTGSSDTESLRIETVLITDENRSQGGLVSRIDPPKYRGAVILCQGADSPAIRYAIVDAVSNATGLTSDKITVAKMK